MKKKVFCIAGGIAGLVLLFITSYSLTNWYYSEKWSTESKSEEEIVATNAEQKEIKDDMLIIKETSGAPKEEKVSDFKEEYKIEGALNKKILDEKLTEEGYEYRTEDDKSIYYTMKNENKKTKLEENKYYLGEYEGKLAVLKGDSDGNPKLESEEDITAKAVSDLKEQDQKNIRNFTKQYGSKEEAKEAITDYIS